MKFVAILVTLFIATVNAKLRIKDDRATIQMGPHGDVSLTRSGPGRLEIDAHVEVKKGLRLSKDTRINGVKLENIIRKLIAAKLGIPFVPAKEEAETTTALLLHGGRGRYPNELYYLCKNISLGIPFRGSDTLETAIKKSVAFYYSLNPDWTLTENFAHLLKMFLGKDLGGAIADNPIDKLLPIDIRGTVGKGFTDLLRLLLPGNFTTLSLEANVKELVDRAIPPEFVPDVPTLVKLLVGSIFGNQSAAVMSMPVKELLPLPLDTRKTVAENVNMLMSFLPKGTSSLSLETSIITLLSILPIDKSKSLPENIEKLLPLVLGNSTDAILGTTIAKLLPLPFRLDSTKTLPGIMADFLKILPPPYNAIPTATILEATATFLKLTVLPKDVFGVLGDIIAEILLSIFPGLGSMTFPDLVYPLVKGIFGNSTDVLVGTSVGDLLGLPFDTTMTPREVIHSLVKRLPPSFPVNASASLAHNLESLFKVLPLDRKMNLSAVPKALLSLFAGNATDAIMSMKIMELLPVPLDTSKSLAAAIDAVLPALPFDGLVKNWTTKSLSHVVADLLRVLPFDSRKALPEVITSLFRAIFPADKEKKEFVDCKNFTIPVAKLPHIPGMLKASKKSHVDILKELEEKVKKGETTVLVTGCETAEKIIGELPHLLDMKISKLLPLPLDYSKTAPAAIAALLPFNTSHTVYGNIAALLPLDGSKITVSALLGSLAFPPGGRVVALVPIANRTTGSNKTKGPVVIPFEIDLTKSLPENVARIVKALPIHPTDLVHAAVGIMDLGLNITKSMAAFLPPNYTLTDLVRLAPLPPNVTKHVVKLVTHLPPNVTRAIAPAVKSVVTAVKSDPDTLRALSHVLAALLPFGLKPDDLYKTLNDLRKDRDFLPKVLADVMGDAATASIGGLFGYKHKTSAEIMAQLLTDLSHCDSPLIGPEFHEDE